MIFENLYSPLMIDKYILFIYLFIYLLYLLLLNRTDKNQKE